MDRKKIFQSKPWTIALHRLTMATARCCDVLIFRKYECQMPNPIISIPKPNFEQKRTQTVTQIIGVAINSK